MKSNFITDELKLSPAGVAKEHEAVLHRRTSSPVRPSPAPTGRASRSTTSSRPSRRRCGRTAYREHGTTTYSLYDQIWTSSDLTVAAAHVMRRTQITGDRGDHDPGASIYPDRMANERLTTFWHSYFGAGTPATLDHVDGLWTDSVTPATYTAPGEDRYRAAVLDQYKVYAEMADRISARRGLTNTFFLSLNTAIFVLLGAAWPGLVKAPFWVLIPPLVALLATCMSWYWLVRSYRQLNGAKYAVIGALEERLPASPYWRGEWITVGLGRDRARYWPFTHVEQWIPIIFALAYLGGFAAIVST